MGLAHAVLRATRLLERLDDVQGVREGVLEKPAPDMLLRSLDALAVPREQALMVGDSRYDEEAAAAAEVPFLHYDMRTGASLLRALRERIV